MFASYGRKRFVPIIIVIAATLVVIYQINRFNVQIISHTHHHQAINAPKTLATSLPTTDTTIPPSSAIVKFVCGKADTVCSDTIDDRIDCFPNGLATEAACVERGCCWKVSNGFTVPSCFFPVNYGYRTRDSTSLISQTFTRALQRCNNPDYRSKGLINIMASVVYHHHLSMLQLKFYDPRYHQSPDFKQSNVSYGMGDFDIYFNENPFALKILRKWTGTTIFDTSTGGFIFENGLIQLSSKLGSRDIYGMEGDSPPRDTFNWYTWKIFSQKLNQNTEKRKQFEFPAYVVNEDNKNNYHVVALQDNPNAKFILQPKPSITMTTNSKESQLELRIYAGENPILNFYSNYYNVSIKDPGIQNIHFIRTMKTRLLANIKPAALRVPIQEFQPAELNHPTTQKRNIKLNIQLQRWAMPYNNTYVVISWTTEINPNAYDYISILCKKEKELGYKSCYHKWLNMWHSDVIVTDLVYDKKSAYYIVYYTYSCNKANACGFIIKDFTLLDIRSPNILSPEDDGYGFVRQPHPLIPPVKVNMANTKPQYNVSRYHHNPYMTASGLYTFNFGIDNSLTYDLKWYHGEKSLMWDYVAIYRHYPKNVTDYIDGQWCWVANFNNSCNTVVEFERNERYYIAYITYDHMKARYLISETAKYHNFTNWMGKYNRFLKYLRINDIVIPGTYCSSCYNMSAPMFTPWSQTQTENIANQLRDGIRYFDLRVKYLSWLQTKFWFSHNKYHSNISLTSFLSTIKAFISKYVNEVVILHFIDFYNFSKYSVHDDLLDIIFEQFEDYLAPNSYINNMLRSFWKDNKRIIVVYDQKSRSSKYQSNDLLWNAIHSIKPSFTTENEMTFQIGDFNRVDNKSLSVVQFTRFQHFDGQIPLSVQTLSNGINQQIDDWLVAKRNKISVNIVTSNYYLGNNMIYLAIKRNIEMGKQANLYSNHDNAT